jgi:predicted ester cyclase
MADPQTIKIAHALIDGFNEHDLDVWQKQLAPDFIAEYPGARGVDTPTARQFNQAFLTAFPDVHFDVHEAVANESVVAIHWTASGNFTAPLRIATGQTMQPNGRYASVTGMLLVTIHDGKIVREQCYWSELELLGQLAPQPTA